MLKAAVIALALVASIEHYAAPEAVDALPRIALIAKKGS